MPIGPTVGPEVGCRPGSRLAVSRPSPGRLRYKVTSGTPTHAFRPTCHIFYGMRVIDVIDGLPKWSGHKGQSTLLQEN